MLESPAPVVRPRFALPPLAIAVPVGLALLAMAAVFAFGVSHYAPAIKAQDLWSPTLRDQAHLILLIAAPLTACCVWLTPVRRLRGWPSLVAIGVLAAALGGGGGAFLAVAALLATCLIAGHAVLLVGGVRERIDPAIGAATGVGVISLLVVVLNVAHLPRLHLPMVPVFWLILAAALGLALGWRALRCAMRESWSHLLAEGASWGIPRAVCAWLILSGWLFYAANAALPERFWDAMSMHMLIPTQIVNFGHWTFDPTRYAFAFFPLAADYLFAFAMALGGEQAPNLVNLALFAGMLFALHGLVRSFAGPRWAEICVLLTMGVPIALLSTSSVMVENLLCFFTVAAVRGLLLLERPNQRQGLLALCVLLPALAAVKLHGAVTAVGGAAIALSRIRYRQLTRQDWLAVAGFAVPFGLAGLSQYGYAAFRTGNPVFPMMNDIFRSPLWAFAPIEDLRWQGHLTWDILYKMTFETHGYVEAYDGAIGFALLALLPAGVLAVVLAPRREPLTALVLAAFYCMMVGVQVQYARYLYPAFPLLLAVGVYGLASLGHRWARMGAAGYAVALGALGLAVLPAGAWTLRSADLKAAYDARARHALLQAVVPTRLATDAVNTLGMQEPRVIYGGEPYGALLRGVPIYAIWTNRPLNTALLSTEDPNALDAVLDAQHADFVIAAPTSTLPWEAKVVAYAQRRGVKVADIGAVTLWRISPL